MLQQSALLTGARQTMLSWVKVIETLADIPEIYQDAYQAIVAERDELPHTVLAPAMGGWRHKSLERLLFDIDDTFYILERQGPRLAVLGYPFKNIGSLEIGNSLLYSWFTIWGITTEREAECSTIAYNTATQRHLNPFLEKMRPASTRSDVQSQQQEMEKFDYLGKLNYKFMNFARASVSDGARVILSIWQPQIRRVVKLFGRAFYRTLALAHLAIVTDREIILIGDDERSNVNRGKRYGGIWQYIGKERVLSAAMREHSDGLLMLTMEIFPGTRIEQIFEADRGEVLAEFISLVANEN